MVDVTNSIARDHGHRGGLTAAGSASFGAPEISLDQSLDVLASQLLRLGWTVRLPRTARDSQVGILAVSARGFSPSELVQLDARRGLSFVTSGESLPVADVAELVRELRRRQATQMVRPPETVLA